MSEKSNYSTVDLFAGMPIPGARKDDTGKPMVHSLALAYFPRALRAVTEVSEFGLEKYKAKPEDKGFLKVDNPIRRYTDGLVRHLIDEVVDGPINEKDGGLHHDAQVAWNALARVEMRLIQEERIKGATEYAPGRMGGVPTPLGE